MNLFIFEKDLIKFQTIDSFKTFAKKIAERFFCYFRFKNIFSFLEKCFFIFPQNTLLFCSQKYARTQKFLKSNISWYFLSSRNLNFIYIILDHDFTAGLMFDFLAKNPKLREKKSFHTSSKVEVHLSWIYRDKSTILLK